MTYLFFDFEFTGLVQNTTPISLGVVSESGIRFYAEFTDYDPTLVDDWIQENVIKNLSLDHAQPGIESQGDHIAICGTREEISLYFKHWLLQFDKVVFVGDCLAFDWILLCELLGGALNLPKNVNYIPLDLSTALAVHGYDPDINREIFAHDFLVADSVKKHNAMHDALVIQACWRRLMPM